MVISALPYRVRIPDSSHVDVFSITALKTIIATLQGVSVLYTLLGVLRGTAVLTLMSFDIIFYPLAIIGLLRLCAATWLTDDYVYADVKIAPRKQNSSRYNATSNNGGIFLLNPNDNLDPWLSTPLRPEAQLKAPKFS